MPLEEAAVGAFSVDDVMRPPTPTIFQQARRWYRPHAFIRNIIQLKVGFYNFGLLGGRKDGSVPGQFLVSQYLREFEPRRFNSPCSSSDVGPPRAPPTSSDARP